MNKSDFKINSALVQKRFDHVYKSYDEYAAISHEVGRRMMTRLELIKLKPGMILDLGCATGDTTRLLEKRYKKANIIGVDFSRKMIKRARKNQARFSKTLFLQADARAIPVPDFSVDMIVCNLLLPWCDDLDAVFHHWRRKLKPNGLLMFSTLGPDSLSQIRSAWAGVDQHAHVSIFYDMHDVGDKLLQAGFADPVMDAEYLTMQYPNVDACVNELVKSGGSQVFATSNKGLMSPRKFSRFKSELEKFTIEEGKIPLTYEIVNGHAWASGIVSEQDADDPTVAYFPVDQIKKHSSR